jgi:glycosyltransferase involved in cell wall biosynthesis
LTLTQDRPEYLVEAIASVEAQTDTDLEHVVYDNGSTDPRVAEVLRDAKRRLGDRFIYFIAPRQPVEGIGVYWNALVAMSRGRYLTILDDDNRKRPDFVERTVAPLEADEGVSAVTCGWARIDEAGRKTGEVHSNLYTSLPALWHNNTIDAGAMTFRRQAFEDVGKFSTTLSTSEDWHFVIRLIQSCKVVHLREALLDYRVHRGARSRKAVDLGQVINMQRVRIELFPEGRP